MMKQSDQHERRECAGQAAPPAARGLPHRQKHVDQALRDLQRGAASARHDDRLEHVAKSHRRKHQADDEQEDIERHRDTTADVLAEVPQSAALALTSAGPLSRWAAGPKDLSDNEKSRERAGARP